jgi:hypothetical protein
MKPTVMVLLVTAIGAASTLFGCAASRDARGEGMDTTTMPADVRDDYDVFAHRCSKCHSLARPLNSGIDDDEFWTTYVARMRRQPGSGINQADADVILRFLRYFSSEQRRIKASGGAATAPANAHAAPATSSAPSSASPPSSQPASPAAQPVAPPPSSREAPDASRPSEPHAAPAMSDGGV